MQVIKIHLDVETARVLRQRGFRVWRDDGGLAWIGAAAEAEAVRAALKQTRKAGGEKSCNS